MSRDTKWPDKAEGARRELEALSEPPVCACAKCRAMCRKCACWPTPDEARRLIAAGYGDRLMLDSYYLVGEGEGKVFVLMPAAPKHGGERAVSWVKGLGCGLLFAGRCLLHDQGLKPIDGKLAHHAVRYGWGFYYKIALTWTTPGAKWLVQYWQMHYEKAAR